MVIWKPSKFWLNNFPCKVTMMDVTARRDTLKSTIAAMEKELSALEQQKEQAK